MRINIYFCAHTRHPEKHMPSSVFLPVKIIYMETWCQYVVAVCVVFMNRIDEKEKSKNNLSKLDELFTQTYLIVILVSKIISNIIWDFSNTLHILVHLSWLGAAYLQRLLFKLQIMMLKNGRNSIHKMIVIGIPHIYYMCVY